MLTCALLLTWGNNSLKSPQIFHKHPVSCIVHWNCYKLVDKINEQMNFSRNAQVLIVPRQSKLIQNSDLKMNTLNRK